MPLDTLVSLSISSLVPHEILSSMAIPLANSPPLVVKGGFALLKQGLTGLPFSILLRAVCPCGNECAEGSCVIKDVYFERGFRYDTGKVGLALKCCRTYRDAEFRYLDLPGHLPLVRFENLNFERAIPFELSLAAITLPSFKSGEVKQVRAHCSFLFVGGPLPAELVKTEGGTSVYHYCFQNSATPVNPLGKTARMMPSAKPKSLAELLKELDEQA